jgi:hypothetical protein
MANRINKTAALNMPNRESSECRLSRSYTNPMMDRLTGKREEAIEQFTALEPVGRMHREEIANAVVWMCSDEASL